MQNFSSNYYVKVHDQNKMKATHRNNQRVSDEVSSACKMASPETQHSTGSLASFYPMVTPDNWLLGNVSTRIWPLDTQTVYAS